MPKKRPPTRIEKAANLVRFREALLETEDDGDGKAVERAAAQTRVPRSTAYRVRREDQEVSLRAKQPSVAPFDLSQILKTLFEAGGTANDEALLAAFGFTSWIRYPRDRERCVHAAALMILRYSYLRDGTRTLDRLRPSFQSQLLQMYSINFLCDAFHPGRRARLPSINDEENDPWGNDYFGIVTKVVQYLTSQNGDDEMPPDLDASLNFVNSRYAGVGPLRSERRLREIWRAHSPASAFIYVAKAKATFDCCFNPHSDSFDQDIDLWLKQSSTLKTFLGHAHWLNDVIDARLSPQQRLRAALPSFPAEVTRLPCTSFRTAQLQSQQVRARI